MRRALVVALLLVASVAAAQHSQRDVSLRHGYPEYLALQSRVALTGACTWTVASGSVTLTEVGDCAALTTEVSAGDVLLIPGDSNTSTTCGGPQNVDSYTVLSVNDTDVGGADGDIDSFTLCRGHDVGATGVTVYLIGQGLGASLTTVGSWDGTASALDLSTGGARVRGDVAAGVNGAGGAAGSLTLNNGLNPGSSTTITQPELAMLDGIMAGAGDAGKALVLDSSADVASGLRNVTASGTVGAGTLTEGGIGVPNLDELDASSELAAIIDDEVGAGFALFGGSNYAGLITLERDADTSAQVFELFNGQDPETGETDATVEQVISFDGSVGGVVAKHEACSWRYKQLSDWFHATTEADHDASAELWCTTNGTETKYATFGASGFALNLADSFTTNGSVNANTTVTGQTGVISGTTSTHDRILITPVAKGAGQFDGTVTSADLTAARQWSFPDDSGTVALSGTSDTLDHTFDTLSFADSAARTLISFADVDTAGNYTGLDFSGGAGFNDASDRPITLPGGYYIDGAGQAVLNASTFPRIRLQSTGGASGAVANECGIGTDRIGCEGANVDADEIGFYFPVSTDGGAGDQGGRYDATATMAVDGGVSISIPDSGADSNPAAYTLTTTAYESMYLLTCLDDEGCAVTLSEVDLGSVACHSSHRITIVQVTGTYDLTMADSAGVQELSAAWAPDTEADNISFMYSTTLSAWLETARSNL